MNITDEELEMLENCHSSEDWNAACDKIKKARKGQYPPDWWPRVKMSGMMDRVMARFGADSELHAQVQEADGSWRNIN